MGGVEDALEPVENIHFYGSHTVDVAGELAKLDTDGYRPLRATQLG